MWGLVHPGGSSSRSSSSSSSRRRRRRRRPRCRRRLVNQYTCNTAAARTAIVEQWYNRSIVA